jgi:hypothetical protein
MMLVGKPVSPPDIVTPANLELQVDKRTAKADQQAYPPLVVGLGIVTAVRRRVTYCYVPASLRFTSQFARLRLVDLGTLRTCLPTGVVTGRHQPGIDVT